MTLHIVIGFAGLLAGFWVPAYSGVDENGYFAAGRRLALTGDAVKHTTHPLQHVSENVVQVADDTYYPKYPLGLPWLVAAGYRLGGEAGAFWVNPILATLAVGGMFFLGQALLGTFAGWVAALLLATNPVHAAYGNGAVSHAGAVCFAVWGMFFLWRWTQHGGWGHALATGAALAYAWTIRYSEALLFLPAVVMVAWRFGTLPEGASPAERRRVTQQWRGEVLLMGAGALLVAAPLLAHHWTAFGAPWRNGYDLCGESTGFAWKWFQENWWLMLTRLNTPGLLLIFPLGLAGLTYWVVHDRQRGVFLALWAVPAMLLYTAYYWAPQGDGRSYIRFFVSVFPPLILGALALLLETVRPRAGWTLAVGGFLALVTSYNLREALLELDKQRDRLDHVRRTWDHVQTRVPPGAIVLAQHATLNHLEFAGDYELYATETFDRQAIQRRLKVLEDDAPHPYQRRKARQLSEQVGNRSESQLAQLQREFLSTHLAAGKVIMAVGADDQFRAWRGRLGERFSFRPVATWAGPAVATRRNEPRADSWAVYQLAPRATPPSLPNAIAALEEKVDQLQFRARTMRDDFNLKYPGAQEDWAALTETERQLRDARDQLRALQDRRAGITPPARPRR